MSRIVLRTFDGRSSKATCCLPSSLISRAHSSHVLSLASITRQRSLLPTMDAPHRIHHLSQMPTPIANRHILVTLHTNTRLQTTGLSCNIAPIAARFLRIGGPELLAAGRREPTDGAGQSTGQEDATTARFSVILRTSNPSLLPQFKLWPCIFLPVLEQRILSAMAGVAFWTPCTPLPPIYYVHRKRMDDQGQAPITHRHPATLEAGLDLARNGPVCSFPSKSPCYIRVAS